jgi:dihydrofolate reductase
MAKIIVAYSEKNKVIGNKGKLPWKIKEEMKFFSGLTAGATVIVGAKTYKSIHPSYWEGKMVIGVSRTDFSIFNPKHVKAVYNSLQNALWSHPYAWIIGGESIYNQCLTEEFMKWIKHVICSIVSDPVDAPYTGDAYFNHDLQPLNFSELLSKKTSWGCIKYYSQPGSGEFNNVDELTRYIKGYEVN